MKINPPKELPADPEERKKAIEKMEKEAHADLAKQYSVLRDSVKENSIDGPPLSIGAAA